MQWTLEKRKVSELTPHPQNPRRLSKHDAQHLQQSLEKFGQCEPIVINSDGVIIGGHQRVKTLKKMGEKEVDVYVPYQPLSEQEVKELGIRLNRNNGEWDFDMLANEWDLGDLLDWGFTEDDLQVDKEVIDALEESESEEDKIKKIVIEAHEEDATSLKNRIKDLLEAFPRCKLKI